MIPISDPVVAIAFDEALALRIALDDEQTQRAARQPGSVDLPPGSRYETVADVIEREGPTPPRIH